MNDVALFVVLALAAHRATRLITTDTILDRQREWWFLHFPPNKDWARRYRQVWDDRSGAFREAGPWRPVIIRKRKPNGGVRVAWSLASLPKRSIHPLGVLVDCAWCIGFWISGAVVLAAVQYRSIPLPVAWWAAISSAVGGYAKAVDS